MRCGRFKRSTDGDLCPRCRSQVPPTREDAPEARAELGPTQDERAVLLRRVREDFVVARPSQLHAGRTSYAGLGVQRDDARSSAGFGHSPARKPGRGSGRGSSRVRTAAIMLAIVLIGGFIAAGIPLLLSWVGS
jgi:hypothetical protein